MRVATKAQRKAFHRIYMRDTSVAPSYRAFRKTIYAASQWYMVAWKGMYLGIEPDGYVHS